MDISLSDERATAEGTERPLRADARRNRDRILAAAVEVFGADGADAQMDDVARAAELGVGTLYRHFPTKTALMVELVRRKIVRFSANLERAEVEHEDPFEALAYTMRSNAESLEDDAATRHAMGVGTEIWSQLTEEQAPLLEHTERLIERGRKEGRLREDLGANDISMLMCGIAASIDRGFDWRRHLELVLDGMRPRP
jgi:AcrR family transcriptional regulator